jgi:predicted glycosyltransferase
MKEVICRSGSIITRPGYTTIMELISLNCSALVIPTPGQTEQEYLALYLAGKGWFTSVLQKNLNEDILLPPIKSKWSSEIIMQSKILLDKALKEMSEEEEAKT